MTRPTLLATLSFFLAITLPLPLIAQDWIYQTQEGDNLWDICLEYTNKRGCWQQLGPHNNMADDDYIPPGSEIRIPIHWLSNLPVVGKALDVVGDVEYQGFARAAEALKSGQALRLGARITSRDGNARLQFGKHGQVLLRRNSVLELNTMSSGDGPKQTSRLHLLQGEVEAEVVRESNSRFEIYTPAAVAAVRGTQFRVSGDAVAGAEQTSSMRSEVTEGLVRVNGAASVDVPEGFGVRADAGAAPEPPRKLLNPPLLDEASLASPLPARVTWEDNVGARTWRLDLYAAGENGSLLRTDVSGSAEFTYADLEQTCYRLVVRGIDQDGFNGLDSDNKLCIEPPPPPPPEEPADYRPLAIWAVLAALMLL